MIGFKCITLLSNVYKIWFGRATQDAGIETRRGAMTRDQAINLVNLYDGVFPKEHVDKYLEYFE